MVVLKLGYRIIKLCSRFIHLAIEYHPISPPSVWQFPGEKWKNISAHNFQSIKVQLRKEKKKDLPHAYNIIGSQIFVE